MSADAAANVDVVVIGDGPAGSALALACHRADIEVMLVGDDRPWEATYSTWVDEVPPRSAGGLVDAHSLLATRLDEVWAHGNRAHVLRRPYATFDNELLRGALRDGVTHRRERVVDVVGPAPGGATGHRVQLLDGDAVYARVVVDASGWPPRFADAPSRRQVASPAWQTAFGIVLAEAPVGDLGQPTLMDFRPIAGATGPTTFCYSLPMSDGWLVEETVLAARPLVEPRMLLPRLASRLGREVEDLLAAAVRTEQVRIPLGGPVPSDGSTVVPFGAAASYVHAATGFSVAASIRAAPRVAAAIAAALGGAAGRPGPIDVRPVADAVWPRSLRRTRVLHDYGLDVLLDLDDDAVRSFFDAFFDLDVSDWSSYLRIDTPPAQVSAVMARLFRGSSWSTRRRLAGRNPSPLLQALRR